MPKINFVTFCCYDPHHYGGHQGTDLPRDIEIVGYLYDSIKKHHPDDTFTLITNVPVPIKERLEGAQILEKNIDANELMYERTKCYTDYVNDDRNDCDLVVFLDSDCLLISNISDVLADEFDIALTCKKSGFGKPPEIDEMGFFSYGNISPINGGVIFSKCTPAAKKTWRKILTTYDDLAAMGERIFEGRDHIKNANGIRDIKKWGGDQFALMNLFSKFLIPDFPKDAVVDGAKLLFLDRNEFNASPSIDGARLGFSTPTAPRIIHMKGKKAKTFIPGVAKHFGI